ncbi:MAG: hypothetical protein AB8G22_08335 [Saprospiraceae bacterium]
MKELALKNLRNFIPLFLLSMTVHTEVPTFLRRYPVWQGFWKYNWVSKFLLVVAMILGFSSLGKLTSWWSGADTSTMLGFAGSVTDLAQDFGSTAYGLLADGGMKYVILLLVEVLIFHATYKTLDIITEEKHPEPALDDFIRAERRMFEIVIRSWVLELLVMIAVGAILGIIGLDILENSIHILVQCYFLGLAVIDNYHEHRGRTIRQSYAITHQVIGLAFGVGLILYLLLMIPLVGVIIGPLVASVAATLAMNDVERNWDLDIVIPPKKEKRKRKKRTKVA